MQDFSTRRALQARVALSLLSVGTDLVGELCEHLSWFLTFVERLGVNMDTVHAVFNKHFGGGQSR